jgi:Skp family chaperone for outer membrane proteins
MTPTRISALRRGHCGCPAVLAGIAAAMLLAAGPATAALYKWVDASGRVSYSDQPPPGNVKSEIVIAPAPPANADAVRNLANQEAELKKRQAQRADDQKKAEKARVDQTARQESCAEARGQIKMYQADVLVQRVNAKGEPVFMDDSMKKKERERLEAMVREKCPA